jgi:hypothetical protein
MPARFEKREGELCHIMGVPVGVAIARGGRVVFAVGVVDGDGLLESDDDIRRAANRWRGKLDIPPEIGKDSG